MRGDVFDAGDLDAGVLDRPNRGLTAGAGAFGEDIDFANTVFHRFASRGFGGLLSGERGALAGALEAHVASTCPGEDVSFQIADGHDRVVERRLDVGDAVGDVLAFSAAGTTSPGLRRGHYLRTFFFPAMAFFGPLRVRALVWVR